MVDVIIRTMIYAANRSEKKEMDNRIAVSIGKRQLVDSIWKSAGIEGLGTTFPNTEKILENLPVQTRKEEVFFIVNMKRAWEFLFDNIDAPNNLAFLRELNRICLDNLAYGGGEIRKVPVSVGGTSWKPEIPNREVVLSEIEEIVKQKNPLEAALDLFCYVCRSQIFIDGNKRVAQLICNKLLMQHDIGVLSVPYDRIGVFKEELVRFYEEGDNQKLKDFLQSEAVQLVKTSV